MSYKMISSDLAVILSRELLRHAGHLQLVEMEATQPEITTSIQTIYCVVCDTIVDVLVDGIHITPKGMDYLIRHGLNA